MKIYTEREHKAIVGFLNSGHWYTFIEWIIQHLAENEIDVKKCRSLLASRVHIHCNNGHYVRNQMCKHFNALYGVESLALLSPREMKMTLEHNEKVLKEQSTLRQEQESSKSTPKT